MTTHKPSSELWLSISACRTKETWCLSESTIGADQVSMSFAVTTQCITHIIIIIVTTLIMCLANAKRTAEILKGDPKYMGASLIKGHSHFSSGFGFMVSLGFCSIGVLNPRVGHIMDVPSPFISVRNPRYGNVSTYSSCSSRYLTRSIQCGHPSVGGQLSTSLGGK